MKKALTFIFNNGYTLTFDLDQLDNQILLEDFRRQNFTQVEARNEQGKYFVIMKSNVLYVEIG